MLEIHRMGKEWRVTRENGTGSMYTHPHVADVFLVAYGLVGLVDGWRTLGATPVAKARVSATVVVPALIAVAQGATGCAARALETWREWTTPHSRCTFTVHTHTGEHTRKKRVSSCVERVYVSSIVYFSFFPFFQIVEKYDWAVCSRAMDAHRFEKRGSSHCGNAFNVYIGFQRLYCPRYTDLWKSSPERNRETPLDRFGNNFGFGKWIFWKKKKDILIGLRLFFTLRSVVIDLVQKSFFDFPLVNFSRDTDLLDVATFCCLKNKFVEMKIVKIEIRKRRSLPAIFY